MESLKSNVTKDSSNTYKSIFKSTFIFGSTQIFQMLIMLIRTKVSAIYLGPVGLGLVSVFQTSIITISQFSSLGVPQSGVREISNSPIESQERAIYIFSRLMNYLSILGVITMLALSFLLSKISFQSTDYVYSFFALSAAVGFHILSQKQLTIMQSTRQTKGIALSSLLAATFSLIFGIVGYKFYGIVAIVPVLILSYFSQFLIGYFIIKKHVEKTTMTRNDLVSKSIPLLKLGVTLVLSVVLINLYNVLFNAYISKYGSMEDLGFYNSAFSITNGNILILISVLTSDFYPRLSSVSGNNQQTKIILNQQGKLLILLTTPLVIMMIVFAPYFVNILLAEKFQIIVPMLRLMSLGLIFRVVWQCMSYVLLAQGDKKNYFIYDALIGNGSVFGINIVTYYLYGLQGLGYAFVISSICVSFILYINVRNRFKINFNGYFYRSLFFCISLAVLSYLISYYNYPFLVSIFIFLISIIYSIFLILKDGDFNIINKIKRKLV